MENLTREQRLAQKYPPSHRWRFLGTIMAYRFVAMGLANGAFSLLLTSMIADMGFTDVQRAAIVSINSTGQLIATLFIGFLLDRGSAKKLMAFMIMLVGGVTCLLRGFTESYEVWLVIMFLWGFAYSSCIVATMKIVGLWFNKKQVNDVTGYFTLSGPLGQLIGMQVTISLAAMLGGWKNYFILAGVLMLIIFVIFLLICKERPNEDSEVPPNYEKKDTGLFKDIIGLARTPRLWFLFLGDAVQAAMITLATTYGQIVLQNDPGWGLDAATARRGSQMVMLGAVIGYFVIPKLTRLISRGKSSTDHAIAFFSIGCGIFTAVVYSVGYLSYNYNLLLVLLLLGGIGQGGYVVGPKSIMVAQPEVAGGRAGSAAAFCNIIGRLGLVIVSAAMGSLAIALNDGAPMMLLLYGVLICGPIFLIIYLVLDNRRLKKLAKTQQP